MTKIPSEIGSTLHAYKLVQANITEKTGSLKQNIDNAKRKGLPHPHQSIPESISKYVEWVKARYRNKESNPDLHQFYMVYGRFLYIFNHNKSILITVFELPEHCLEDAKKLSEKVKNSSKKKRHSSKQELLTKPLNPPMKSEKKQKKKKRKKKVTS